MKIERPTKKQIEFIRDMEEWGCPKFKGTTKREASIYIDENIEWFKLMQQDNWTLKYI